MQQFREQYIKKHHTKEQVIPNRTFRDIVDAGCALF